MANYGTIFDLNGVTLFPPYDFDQLIFQQPLFGRDSPFHFGNFWFARSVGNFGRQVPDPPEDTSSFTFGVADTIPTKICTVGRAIFKAAARRGKSGTALNISISRIQPDFAKRRLKCNNVPK
jgi:hypothetical protein